MKKELQGCGCCARELTGHDDCFCEDCLTHVAKGNAPPWDRTWFAVTAKECPFRDTETEEDAMREMGDEREPEDTP